jgi:hypothetical protein
MITKYELLQYVILSMVLLLSLSLSLSLVFPNNFNNTFYTFPQVWRLAVPFIVSLGLV